VSLRARARAGFGPQTCARADGQAATTHPPWHARHPHGTPGIRRGTPGTGFMPSAEQMKARARAIDDLFSRDDHEM